MATLNRWKGASWECNHCGASGLAGPDDFKDGHLFTRYEGVRSKVIQGDAAGGGLLMDCPECRTEASVVTKGIPQFYGAFIKYIPGKRNEIDGKKVEA